MRHVATAALFLSLIQSNANAELAAPPRVAADDVNSAAAATLVREADTPRVIGETAQDTGAKAKGPPEADSGRVETPAPAKDFDFMCQTLESAARLNDLPVAFLTRLIWQESRFDAYAVSPAGARGVAQFMPQTAAGRGLANPFDVTDAINKSAEFLRDLTKQFGNLGLAAAAYNAGPKRVQDWLAGSGSLPLETEAYVRITTGHGANDWRLAEPNQWTLMLPEAIPCPQLVKALADTPERIAPQGKPASARVAAPAETVWGGQLIGDDSQASALAEYYQLQKTYKSVLGGHQPLVLRQRLGEAAFCIGCVSWRTVSSRRRDCARTCAQQAEAVSSSGTDCRCAGSDRTADPHHHAQPDNSHRRGSRTAWMAGRRRSAERPFFDGLCPAMT